MVNVTYLTSRSRRKAKCPRWGGSRVLWMSSSSFLGFKVNLRNVSFPAPFAPGLLPSAQRPWSVRASPFFLPALLMKVLIFQRSWLLRYSTDPRLFLFPCLCLPKPRREQLGLMEAFLQGTSQAGRSV